MGSIWEKGWSELGLASIIVLVEQPRLKANATLISGIIVIQPGISQLWSALSLNTLMQLMVNLVCARLLLIWRSF
jgi:hypothetical protein